MSMKKKVIIGIIVLLILAGAVIAVSIINKQNEANQAKVPIWFFAPPKSTPVFPPIAASTIASKVVGMLMNLMPLL